MRTVMPVVAIDLDGTLADYHGHFIKFSEAFYHKAVPLDFPPYDGTGRFRAWWCAAFKRSNDEWRQVKLAYRQGAQKRSQPLIQPEVDHHWWFTTLTRMGVEVWITTTRPYLSLDRVDPDTRFWLAEHGIDFYGLLYDDDKYTVLHDRVGPGRVIAVLDDLPEMYDAAVKLFGDEVPILRRSQYNETQDRPNVAAGLEEAGRHIARNLQEWRRYHG
jgi:hypothetical protein